MAWFSFIFFSIFFFSLNVPNIVKSSSISPSAFVFPISKDGLTNKHIMTIHQRTPLTAVDVAVDLGGSFLWVTCCSSVHKSATYESLNCHSPQCALAKYQTESSAKCKENRPCNVYSKNIFNSKVRKMKLSQDVLNLQSTNGFNPSSISSIPKFLFLCSPRFHSKPKHLTAKGVAGLGHGQLGLPSQISNTFNISRKFSICLSPSQYGVLFFGDGPYVFSPGIDLSKILNETPLYLNDNPKNDNCHPHEQSHTNDYFIKVNFLRVESTRIIPLHNSSLLAKISTNDPYTILETSIYNPLTMAFMKEAILANFTRVQPKGPFDVCFSTRDQGYQSEDAIRLSMPVIDFVLEDTRIFWRVFGLNSMVQMGNETICLGIIDGGLAPKDPFIIGTNLLENNLLQFNLESSILGFTNLLMRWGTDCASFNFTSI